MELPISTNRSYKSSSNYSFNMDKKTIFKDEYNKNKEFYEQFMLRNINDYKVFIKP